MAAERCLASDGFPANFIKYVETELKCSRLVISDIPPGYETTWPKESWVGTKWVFWNRKDDDDHVDVFASSKFRLDIRHALDKLVLHPELDFCLAQFWAPTKTPEGRTSLTTQFQPFAIGDTPVWKRQHLCNYRMGMYKDYTFCGETESGKEQFGLPGRVFLSQVPESAEDVEFYSLKEYPQRELALNCKIGASLALPVFEYSSHASSHACVGVLEIVSLQSITQFWYDDVFRGRMNEIFKEFGLQSFDGYKQCKFQYGDENTDAFHEVEMVCDKVLRIHKLPLALTWVSCPSCKDLLQRQFQFQVKKNYVNVVYEKVTKGYHLSKGYFTGTILPFPNSLYCSDVKRLSMTEYPLVHNARSCKFGGRFTTCLHSSYTGNDLYVLEFFFPASITNEKNILKTLRSIFDIYRESKTFKLASGQEWGEELSIEVINFQNDQKCPSIQKIPATRIIRGTEPLREESMLHRGQLPMNASNKGKNVITAEPNIPRLERKRKGQARDFKRTGVKTKVSLEDIICHSKLNARQLKVSIPTMKRIYQENGIDWWPPQNIENFQPSPVENQGQFQQQNFDLHSNEDSCSVAKINPGFQDADEEVHPLLTSPVQNQRQSPQGNFGLHGNEDLCPGSQEEEKVTIMAKISDLIYALKFQLSLSSGLEELHKEVAERKVDLEAGTYHVKYEEEEGLILVACDEDLQHYMKTCKSQGQTPIRVQLHRK